MDARWILKLITMPITQKQTEREMSKSCALVNKQIEHELFNERLYLAMAVWCNANGLTETSKFFALHAAEEKEHAMDFINHYLMMGKMPEITGTKAPKTSYTDLTELLTDALKQEHETTALIQNLLKVGLEEQTLLIDIAYKYIEEQKEETQLFNSLLYLWKCCGGSKMDFEMEVMKLKSKKDCKYRLGSLPK
jgi:ferritin